MQKMEVDFKRVVDKQYQPTEELEEIIRFTGYKTHPAKLILYWTLVICTLGIYWLLGRWFPRLYIKTTCFKSTLTDANRICAKGEYGELTKIYIEKNHYLIENKSQKWFTWRHQVWRWYEDVEDLPTCAKYRPVRYPFNIPLRSLSSVAFNSGFNHYINNLNNNNNENNQLKPQNIHFKEILSNLYGRNLIEISVPNPILLLFDEVLHPFYIFQIFAVLLWYYDDYAVYATAIVIVSTIGALIGVYQTRSNLLNLKKLAEYQCQIRKLSSQIWEKGSSERLLPGDIIDITQDLNLPCDVVLISGQAIMNESMLSGESIPVSKVPLPQLHHDQDYIDDDDEIYSPDTRHSKHTLFGGTIVVQTKPDPLSAGVYGMVIQTGFSTTKGRLIRSIMHPKPTDLKFYRDSFYFIGFLFSVASFGFLLTVIWWRQMGIVWSEIWVKAISLYTIAIPPALPIALTIGIVFALARLKKRKIFCVVPKRINTAGLVNYLCFDKTGTLTADGLDVTAICPSSPPFPLHRYHQQLHSHHQNNNNNYKDNIIIIEHKNDGEIENLDKKKAEFQRETSDIESSNSMIIYALSSCHSLSLLHSEKLIGDTLDIKMFESTKWQYIESISDLSNSFSSPSLSHSHHLSQSNQPLSSPSLVTFPIETTKIDDLKKVIDISNQSHGGDLKIETIVKYDNSLKNAFTLNSNQSAQRKEVAIIKRFDFSSDIQRMSTLCYNLEADHLDDDQENHHKDRENTPVNFFLTTKGAPEAIARISLPSSLPPDFEITLNTYTRCGYRVIACAIKPLLIADIHKKREELEKDLIFVGFLILENRLKGETSGAIFQLNKANLKSVIVTGDNPLTAIHVATECSIIPSSSSVYLATEIDGSLYWKNINEEFDSPLIPFSFYKEQISDEQYESAPLLDDNFNNNNNNNNIKQYPKQYSKNHQNNYNEKEEKKEFSVTGNIFAIMSEEDLDYYIDKISVFARMKPLQKQSLIEHLQKKEYLVVMCGDGANDCGALKSADVGISLSEADASIAAPFTSSIANITCVLEVLREGRCSIVTSFQAFKYMASYSLIQFISCLVLSAIGSYVGDMQFLWIDLFIVLPLAFASEYTGAYTKLSKKLPENALLSFPVIFSLLFQTVVNLFFQVFGLLFLRTQSWYVQLVPNTEDVVILCPENTIVILLSFFQYISSVFAFSVGKPYRLPFYSNWVYVITLTILLFCNMYIVLYPSEWVYKLFELEWVSHSFSILILSLAICNCVIVVVGEQILHSYLYPLYSSLKAKFLLKKLNNKNNNEK